LRFDLPVRSQSYQTAKGTTARRALDGTERMIGRDGGVEVQDGEEEGSSLRFAADAFETPLTPPCSNSRETFFNSLLMKGSFR
jgi:hypothetical protein